MKAKKQSFRFVSTELRSMADTAYEKIKQAIVTGKLSPSSRISDRKLAEAMGVSTTTVKRALHRLSVEGLVEIRPRKGTFVTEIVSANMEEITIIRAHLEGLVARFAAEKATTEDIERLRKQIDLMRSHTEDRHFRKLVEVNTHFHRLIHRVGGNPFAARLITVIRSFDIGFRMRALLDTEESLRGFHEHVSVFEAIARGDKEQAEQRMKNHIMRTLDFVLHGAESNDGGGEFKSRDEQDQG